MGKYFLTVDWCNTGNRGIFCSFEGMAFPKEEPHTKEEMANILGIFWIILSPKSELFTKEEVKQFGEFRPLGEYSNEYGIALKTT